MVSELRDNHASCAAQVVSLCHVQAHEEAVTANHPQAKNGKERGEIANLSSLMISIACSVIHRERANRVQAVIRRKTHYIHNDTQGHAAETSCDV